LLGTASALRNPLICAASLALGFRLISLNVLHRGTLFFVLLQFFPRFELRSAALASHLSVNHDLISFS
jgi:hypothetical protein